MSKSGIAPYLHFNGNCAEAVKFYCKVFGGDIQFSSPYKDAPMDVPANWKEKIMHTSFVINGASVLASDTFPGNDITFGNSVTLSLNYPVSDKAQLTDHFNQMSKGGKVNMPLQDTFWGSYFGMLTDQFGINWMFSTEHK